MADEDVPVAKGLTRAAASEPIMKWEPPSDATPETVHRRSRSRRVGALAAVAWVVVGLPIGLLESQIGRLPAIAVALLYGAGPVALVIIGRRSGLKGRRDWNQAALVMLGLGLLLLFVVIATGFFLTIQRYG